MPNENLVEALKPFVQEINRLEREYGFDRPLHQYQCMMLPLSDLIRFREVYSTISLSDTGKVLDRVDGEVTCVDCGYPSSPIRRD